MNKWKKLGLAAGMGTAAFTTAHIINQCIFQAAVSDKITENKSILIQMEIGKCCLHRLW